MTLSVLTTVAIGIATAFVVDIVYIARSHRKPGSPYGKEQKFLSVLFGVMAALGANVLYAVYLSLAGLNTVSRVTMALGSLLMAMFYGMIFLAVQWRNTHNANVISTKASEVNEWLLVIRFYNRLGAFDNRKDMEYAWKGSRTEFLRRWPTGEHPFNDGTAPDGRETACRFYGANYLSDGTVQFYRTSAPIMDNNNPMSEYERINASTALIFEENRV